MMQRQTFKNSTKFLAAKELKTRLLAIYELEEILRTYPGYYWQGMQLLANFVRSQANIQSQTSFGSSELLNNSLSHPANTSANISIDVQAALTVIARRDTTQDVDNEILDLSEVDIRGVNLDHGNLQRVSLYRSNLAGASLIRANLCGAVLSAANLTGANLSQANLSQAILGAANLVDTNLEEANLYQANLYLANLRGANLYGTKLDGANLRDVNLYNTILGEVILNK